jgi:hypothetical protein
MQQLHGWTPLRALELFSSIMSWPGPGSVLRFTICAVILASSVPASSCLGQDLAGQPRAPNVNDTLPVNWLYGAFIPKDAPIEPLSGEERFKLYLRQTYTTPGIYIKTGFFLVHDQAKNDPPEWGQGASGFGKRLGSLQAQNIIQNSLTSLGDAAVKFEPRYDRCRCVGAWPRISHAIVRNFVTYGGADDKALRPQIMPFAAAFGAGGAVGSWEPNYPSVLTKGYQSVVTQAWVGIVIDALAEFAPDIKRMLHKDK